MKFFALFIILWVGIVDVTQVSYKRYRTYEVKPINNDQRSALLDLEGADGIDFWSMPTKVKPAVVMVAPRVRQKFTKALDQLEIPYDVVISDLEEAVQSEKSMQMRQQMISRRSLTDDHLSRFLRFSEIVRFLQNAEAESNGTARLEIIGYSFERRPVFMIKLSSDFESGKPVVVLEAGMHAREWAAPALTLHVIDELIRNPTLLANNDYHIIPVANPDGYEYTHTTDRFWRKTRSRQQGKRCIGADGNRNFDTHWGVTGSSNKTCSEIYQGSQAFSEVEARNIRDFGMEYGKRIVLYVAVHSYGNYLLYPMGHTTELLPDAENMESCARIAADAIKNNNGPDFTIGNTATVLYPSGGGSDDYMKEKFHVPFAYTLELPGGGNRGFDLPPEEISSMVREIFPGIIALADCAITFSM